MDYGDVVYMNASAYSLHLLDAAYPKGILLRCTWNLEQAPAEAEAVQLYFAKGLQITCRKAGETVSGDLHIYLTSYFSFVLW